MILQKTNVKIREIEEKIVRDFSEACGSFCILPIQFSKPEKISSHNYRVSADVVEIGGKYYPTNIFAEKIYDCVNGKVVILENEYDSLGTAFRTSDEGYLFGMRIPVTNAKTIDDVSEKMYFDLDLRNFDYNLFNNIENQNQKGND